MISVVIPMYNSKDTIERALDSIKTQTAFHEIGEIIVVNDGSKDNSLEVVKRYSESNKRMPIKIIDKENGGVSTARNAGLKMAQGEYIALLDSDDEWLPRKTEVQLDIFKKNPSLSLIATNLNNQKFDRFLYKKFNYLTEISTIDLVFKNFFQPSTVMFKKSLIEQIGLFPEDQKYAEEGNFFMRASYFANCALVNESFLNFGNGKQGFGESGLSANLVEMQKGEIRNLRFAKKEGFISGILFLTAFMFSYLKYFRRIIITKMR